MFLRSLSPFGLYKSGKRLHCGNSPSELLDHFRSNPDGKMNGYCRIPDPEGDKEKVRNFFGHNLRFKKPKDRSDWQFYPKKDSGFEKKLSIRVRFVPREPVYVVVSGERISFQHNKIPTNLIICLLM